MNKKHIRHFQSWFNDYVSNFYLKGQDQENDWAIQLKEEHSWKVREEIIKISQRLQLSEDDILIAEILGLFHDIGRFHQYEKYRTFRDDISEDHAKIGAQIVTDSHLLEDLTEVEKNIITKGILYHNIHTLPEDLDPRCLFFCKLLRDADKLDIWRIIINYYYKEQDGNSHSILELGLPDTPGYSTTVLNDLYNGQTSSSNTIKNLNDFKLLQIGWVYGINFYPTFQEIKKRNYIEKISSTLTETQALKKAIKRVDNYLMLNLI
ncbi:MAG: HD domain-containing protein [Deltaproteobacteria bacterium]|nr:HD domain-containing protein [Deltaproteobacteria bacterium]